MKKKLGQVLAFCIYVVLGACCGFFGSQIMDMMGAREGGLGTFLIMVGVIIVGLYIAMFLQIMIHEAGHLVGGLLTGYTFSSYRIGSFMWMKENGKIKLKRFSIAGTGGQCLMNPPDMVNGKIPYVIYNLGGSLMNLAAAGVAGLLVLLCHDAAIIKMIFMEIGLVGVAFALLNGVPMQLGTVNNDGYNAISMGKEPAALQAFWVQLKVNEQQTRGVRLKDMPAEWFEMPAAEEMANSMITARAVLVCNRLLDEQKFAQAQEQMLDLLKENVNMSGLYQFILKLDCVFCELVGARRPEILEMLQEKEVQKNCKAMKHLLNVPRTQYAYAVLAEQNLEKGEQYLAEFEKIAKTYPNPVEVEGERELVAFVAELCKKEKI